MRSLTTLTFLAIFLAAGPGSLHAFSSGPPNGRTNAPGEGNCTACHTSFPLNSGSGSLGLTGIPTDYEPGQTYDLTLTLADPDAQRWGFELTVLDGSNQFVGDLLSAGAETQTSTDGGTGREYLKHTSSGTSFGQTVSKNWTVRWVAPAAGAGDVTFYVAGNGANGNFNNQGDRIYADSFSFSENTGTAAPLSAFANRLLPNFPNPFNPSTRISFDLGREQSVRLVIYSLRGERIRTLVDESRGEGLHEVVWDGRDDLGESVASGAYLYRLETQDETLGRTMVLLK